MPAPAAQGFQDYASWFLELISGLRNAPTEPLKPVDLETCGPCTCGLINKKYRIVGGNETYVHQYPWMALLLYNGEFRCGATLINNLYVLTAAHCVRPFLKEFLSVRFLEYDRSTANESEHFDRKVKWFTEHKDYNSDTHDNDIALIRLEEEVQYDDVMRPVCLPVRDESFSNKTDINPDITY
uniref:Ovochymase-1 n=1 Tax=Cacopsylla melanoneura TaxID=428564 RepID=A0A8D9ATV0_9HEMI